MPTQKRGLRAAELLSRVLISGIFIAAGIEKARHRASTERYMKSKNLPLVPAMFGGAVAIELVAAPLLALGLAPRFTAPLLGGFLIPTSVIFHDFWKSEGQERKMQSASFFKNMAIIGGLTAIALRDYESYVRGLRTGEFEVTPETSMKSEDGPRPGYLDEAQFDVA